MVFSSAFDTRRFNEVFILLPLPIFPPTAYSLSQRGHKAVDIDQHGGQEVGQRQLIAGCADAGSARVIPERKEIVRERQITIKLTELD